MQQPTRKKNSGVIILMLMGALALGMLFIVPTITRSCVARPVMPVLSDELKKVYVGFADSQKTAPIEFIARAFDDHDVVFLGDAFYHPTFSLVQQAVPALSKKGVRTIGVDFIYAENQKALDALLSAREFDERAAHELFPTPFILMDGVALCREIWKLNRASPGGRGPLRLLALGMKIDRELFTNEAYKDDKARKRASLNNQTQEDFMLAILEREVIGKREKALLYLLTVYCLKDASLKGLENFYADLGITFKGSLASQVRSQTGPRTFVLLFHNLWTLNESPSTVFPMSGVVDAVIRELPADKRAFGFFTGESPFQGMPVSEQLSRRDKTPILFKDICDGYLVAGPLSEYRLPLLTEAAFDQEQMVTFLQAQGVKPEDIKKTTIKEFIEKLNEQIGTANKEMAELPR